jgi:adenylate cyclase
MKRRGSRPLKQPGRLRTALLIALVPGILGVLCARWPLAEDLERGALDLLFLVRGDRPSPPGVCVVAIDAASYDALGVAGTDPWPRALHAELLNVLKRAGARAVAFDVLFDEPRDPEQDAALERALAETGFAVLGATVEQVYDPRFHQAQRIEPWAPFAAAAAANGEVNLPPDRDGVIRSTWLYHTDRPSLALAAYETATGDSSLRETRTRLIDYYGPPRTIPTISFYQALDPDRYLPRGFFRDRIVFVGLSQASASGPSAKDAFMTPFRGGAGETTFGVEIHATIAGNLLEERRIDLMPRAGEDLLLLMLPLTATFAFMALRPVAGGLTLLGIEVLPWVGAYLAFTRGGLWVPVVIPAAFQLPVAYGASLLWYYLTTVRERERIRRAFSFYLSPDMIDLVTANPESLDLGGEEIDATAVMTDLQGFTALAENMTPREAVALLNTYFTEITASVFETGGTLIKFIGDAVFAIWGAPVRIEDHATRACLAAIAMAKVGSRPGTDARIRGLVTRIAVHTGPMVVGNLGSTQRFDYTAIGDSVNLVSRLEGLNKAFGTTVLASDATIAATDGRFITRPLGRARVVGRSEPVEIHELLGVRGEDVRPDERALKAFAGALAHFVAGRFDDAEAGFREAGALAGSTDGPSRFYLGLVDRFRSAPPRPGWDGVIAFESK